MGHHLEKQRCWRWSFFAGLPEPTIFSFSALFPAQKKGADDFFIFGAGSGPKKGADDFFILFSALVPAPQQRSRQFFHFRRWYRPQKSSRRFFHFRSWFRPKKRSRRFFFHWRRLSRSLVRQEATLFFLNIFTISIIQYSVPKVKQSVKFFTVREFAYAFDTWIRQWERSLGLGRSGSGFPQHNAPVCTEHHMKDTGPMLVRYRNRIWLNLS